MPPEAGAVCVGPLPPAFVPVFVRVLDEGGAVLSPPPSVGGVEDCRGSVCRGADGCVRLVSTGAGV